jgi:tetratricopeptide (TPR) repeat protein
VRLREANAEIRAALQEGFKNHYCNLAGFYYQLLKFQDPRERHGGIHLCRLEYENLYAALQTCLEKHRGFSAIFGCLYMYLEAVNDKQGMLKIAKEVNVALEKYPAEIIEGELGQDAMIALDYLANAYLETKQFDQAKQIYQKEIEVIATLQSVDSNQKGTSRTTSIYHQLGRVAQELREWDNARYNYHQALSIKVEFGDLYSQAGTYHQLGVVAQELREWDDARHNYQQALKIFVEFGDRYAQAGTYHNLGAVAEELREWDHARRNYQQALSIKVEFGDRSSQANTYHHLGMMAEELREWDDARHNYHQALAIKVEFGDLYSQASIYHQLGKMAQELREWDDARYNYRQALAIKVKFGDRYSQASTYGQLGLLAVAEDNLEEAINCLLLALEIFLEFKDQHSVFITIGNLCCISQSNPNPKLLTKIAEIFGVSEAEVQQIFDSMNQGT